MLDYSRQRSATSLSCLVHVYVCGGGVAAIGVGIGYWFCGLASSTIRVRVLVRNRTGISKGKFVVERGGTHRAHPREGNECE